jgi:hypothetical protein
MIDTMDPIFNDGWPQIPLRQGFRRDGGTDPPSPELRRDTGATMALIVLSSPATLTGAGEKKTGPSRFRPLFQRAFLDRITELTG